MAVSLTDGWARFWYKGERLPLPGELLRRFDRANLEVARQRLRADEAERERGDMADQLARLQAELQALRDAGGKVS
jgi:hypothetical protein